jgi:metallo-beta-lactamase class B
MRTGIVPHDDPQFGIITPIARVARVETIQDGQTLQGGAVAITAHFTPGHTPGGTTWTWVSCENKRCLHLVYADSLTPVSSPGFLFSRSNGNRQTVADFNHSFSFLDSTPCDILVTPHPDVSKLWEHLQERESNPDALINPNACRVLAENFREQLKQRLAEENSK